MHFTFMMFHCMSVAKRQKSYFSKNVSNVKKMKTFRDEKELKLLRIFTHTYYESKFIYNLFESFIQIGSILAFFMSSMVPRYVKFAT